MYFFRKKLAISCHHQGCASYTKEQLTNDSKTDQLMHCCLIIKEFKNPELYNSDQIPKLELKTISFLDNKNLFFGQLKKEVFGYSSKRL